MSTATYTRALTARHFRTRSQEALSAAEKAVAAEARQLYREGLRKQAERLEGLLTGLRGLAA